MSLDTTSPAVSTSGTDTPVRVAAAAGAALALVPLALCSFSGQTGEEIASSLARNSAGLQVGAGVAALAAALLLAAAARLGGAVPGAAGRMLTVAGAGVAVLFAAYYASFGAGGLIAGTVGPSAGVGEGTALLVNMTELTRYAPGLALTAAAVVARRQLPRAVWVAGAALAVFTVFPLTSWMAALVIPLWLGLSAAAVGPRR